MYKQIINPETMSLSNNVRRIHDMAIIPADPDNTDYQAYLKWVAEGNTPEPAEGAE